MFKYASANFYTGISETVVVVGVQRLFVAMLVLAWLFGCVVKQNRQCAKSVGSIATKSMTVKNGGNTIDAVEGLASWVSHCISRACGLAGGRSFLAGTDLCVLADFNLLQNHVCHILTSIVW